MRFSIVTPSYNLERWLPATIKSVISQKGDFEIEYIIVDGGSSDKSLDIANRYIKDVNAGNFTVSCRKVSITCIIEKDTGMYEAVNRGFAKATGDVFAWINADDVYKPNAFETVRRAFESMPEAKWIKGITSTIDENGKEIRPGACRIYRQDWLRSGVYGMEAYFVEQDSVFWRRELWQKAGPLSSDMSRAADYSLWMSMAKHAPLFSLNAHISSFRKREGQLSKAVSEYKREQRRARPRRNGNGERARLLFAPQSRITNFLPWTEPLFKLAYSIFFLRTWDRYVELESGKAVLKPFKSYRV